MNLLLILILILLLFAVVFMIRELFSLRRVLRTDDSALAELKFRLSTLSEELSKLEISVRTEIAKNREELNRSLSENRGELGNSFKNLSDQTTRQLETLTQTVDTKMNVFKEHMTLGQQNFREELLKMQNLLNTTTDARLSSIRDTIEKNLKNIQEENGKRLEEMRKTVDEKLQESVEKRFNESFKLISERLELVHKGLGEMQSLATGVGDLKKVLTNVKTRGNLGEIQLAAILEQCLSPEQYITNAVVKPNSSERVEFAVKMPGRDSDSSFILLPVDSKFPVEDYQRLLDAYEQYSGMDEELKSVRKSFESAVRKCASEIHSKYINPPLTTDFAIMFVPTEGLYAEILRRPGLFEQLQHDYKISVVGPANLVAFLNSLQMGFRTLAIEKRSGEVWNVLGAVKTEFGRFGDILDKTRNKLESAVKEIDNAGVRTRSIERKLRTVQELPLPEAERLLSDSPEKKEIDPE